MSPLSMVYSSKKSIFLIPPQKQDSGASLNLKQTAHKSLDYLLNEFSPMLCDTTTPNVDINSSKWEITADEEPCSSQEPNDPITIWLHSKRTIARESKITDTIVSIAASHMPKWQSILKVCAVITWMWQKLLVFLRSQRKEKDN